MPAGHGLRARTRDTFSRPFKRHGYIALGVYLRTYKMGDLVDIKVNSAVQKGMPFKVYHGRTGKVWNVTKRAVGVEVNKQVGHRIIRKRIHVRTEHVVPSRCREAFVKRCKANDAAKHEAHVKKEPVPDCRRKVAGPRPAFMLESPKYETITPIPYDIIKEGIQN